MKKIILLLFISLASIAGTEAQDKIFIHQTNKITLGASLFTLENINFNADGTTVYFNFPDTVPQMATSEIDSISFGNDSRKVHIHYTGTEAEIVNPMAFEGVTVHVEAADVTVYSTTEEEIEYVLSGTATNGMFKIYSDQKLILTLNEVKLTNDDGPAINIQSGEKTSVNLADGTISTLVDGPKYTACGDEDMKGTFFSEGQLIFGGEGTLQVYGNKKHGICSDDYILINSGHFILKEIASDGIHSNNYFQMNGGKITIEASGDGIDGDEGYIVLNGGEIDIQVHGDAKKGIKCDGDLTLNGGTVRIHTTGHVVVEDNDPSYCTALKCKGNLAINGGDLTITSTGTAGKGISIDGNLSITRGNLQITTTGDGGTYTTVDNVADSYSATCIKADGNISILEGTLILSSSGTAGKGISADGEILIGDENHSPVLNVTTTGDKFLVSGRGENADYANPKAVKAKGNLTVHNGTITIRCEKDGGEGLESKSVLTINDGNLDIETYDDAINASTGIVINGGNIYCNSSGNDGIDSNGTLTINGGIILSSGTSSPEEGFDCDQNTFTITGGIIIGTGGSSSTPTSGVCTQRSVLYGTTGTANQLIRIEDADGNDILTYKIPKSYHSMTLLFSSPGLEAKQSYTIYTGGTAVGGTDFHGYYTGSSYSGGSQATTFTSDSMVTTIGSSTGPGGGGKPR